MTMELSEDQIQRYARHILLPDVGGVGQAKLLGARVLIVGAGGLGSPVLLYLAAAGVGTLGIVDADRVDLSNLQRQIVHTTARIGDLKVESARQMLAAINPGVRVEAHSVRLDAANAHQLIGAYDIVADGSDNFATRFLVNDTCVALGKTLVSAAVLRFDAQLATFKPHAGADLPCYRCLYPASPAEGSVASCAEAGVMGALCGAIGSLQAGEVIKEILGIGDTMAGRLMIMDGLGARFRTLSLKRDPACPVCGQTARAAAKDADPAARRAR